MGRIPHVKPGDVVTAEMFNAVAEKLEQCANLTVAQGSGLVMSAGPRNKALGLALPREIWAQLSGSSSPYSWYEVAATSGGTWATTGNLSGTSNAYEINGKASLNGRVVRLSKTPAGDWRFDAECASCNCAAGTAQICATVNDGCGSHLAGATITVKDGTTTVGTCTTDASGQCCVAITKPATYTVTCDFPGTTTKTTTVAATCSLTDNAVTFTYASNTIGTLSVNATKCDPESSSYAGVSVSITGAATASGTTDASGNLTLRLGAGSYSASFSAPGGASGSIGFTITGCSTTTLSVSAVSAMAVKALCDSFPCGCSASVSVTNDTSTTSGSDTLAVTSGVLCSGQVTISITEVFLFTFANFSVTFVWPNLTSTLTTSNVCYGTSTPFVADFRGQTTC